VENAALFQAARLGPYTLKNRIVLPPLTRSRSSQPGNVPNDLMAAYYRQRAGAGFMVSEGTQDWSLGAKAMPGPPASIAGSRSRDGGR